MLVTMRTGYGLRVNGRNRLVIPGQTVTVPDGEAMELIAQGLAVLAVAAPQAEREDPGTGIYPPEDRKPAEAQETPAENEDDLQAMTVSQLKVMVADLGLDASGLKRKQDLIDLIRSAEDDTVEDGETPPTLGAEAPVV